MARFGKLPVQIPAGVTIDITSEKVVVKGAKGEIERQIPQGVVVKKTDSVVLVEKLNNSKQAASTQGTIRSHVLNMIHGVTVGWKKDLEIVGAGFRAEVRGKDLVMNIGYSHPIVVPVPQGISLKVEKSIISVEGVDKEMVGYVSALIRSKREPEPYKGAGIKYTDEVVRRKARKQAGKSTGA